MKTLKLFLPLSLLIHSMLIAQSHNPLKYEPVPIPPQAASITAYGNTPVNLYTGQTSAKIPLYEINSGNVTVPIYLAYSNSGLILDKIPSRVGLGWNLFAGGVITREIRGWADESIKGLMNTNSREELDRYVNGEMTPLERDTFFHQVVEGLLDTENDLFSFNFLGISGQFFIDKEGEIRISPVKNIDFQLHIEDHTIVSITAIDKSGIKYVFEQSVGGTLGISNDGLEVNPGGEFGEFLGKSGNTAWYLTEIQDLQGDTISFAYELESFEYNKHVSSGISRLSSARPVSQSETLTCGPINGVATSISSMTVQVPECRLKTITFKNGTIHFEDGELRYDISQIGLDNQSHMLGGITIVDQQDHQLKNIAFDYENGNRLLLRSLKISGTQEDVENQYNFEYYGENHIPKIDAANTSYAKDHWGYYNNASNTHLLPTTQIPNGIFYEGADRSPNIETTKYGILKKITYPTGGTSEFEYESHDYYVDELSAVPKSLRYDLLNNESLIFDESINDDDHTEIIEVNAPAVWRIVYTISTTDPGTFLTPLIRIGDFFNRGEGYGEEIINVAPGNYTITMEAFSEVGYTSNASLYIYALQPSVEEPVNLDVGGLRIQKITDVGETGTQHIRHFKYENATTGYSSGILRYAPVYERNHEVRFLHSPDDSYVFIDQWCDRFILSSERLNPLQGNYMVYDEVTTYFGENGENGYKISKFLETRAQGTREQPFPYLNTFVWRNGLPVEEIIYNASGQEVRKEKRTYIFLDNEEDTHFYRENSFKVEYRTEDNFYNAFPSRVNEYLISPTYNWSEFYYEIEKEITEVYKTDSISTKITYEYTNPDHLQLTTKTIEDSRGNHRKTIFRYPKDYTNPSSNILEMQHKHMESAIVERFELKDSMITGGYATAFKYHPGKDMVLPEFVYDFHVNNNVFDSYVLSDSGEDFNSPFVKKMTYSQYDALGNPLEVSKEDGTPISYIWGYRHTQPIAKLEGVAYEDIDPAIISNLQTLSDNDIDAPSENTLREALNSLRLDYPNADITTFTYDPLVGVTSITDPKGDTAFYSYDAFNRLEQITDAQGEVIKNYEYDYIENEPQD